MRMRDETMRRNATIPYCRKQLVCAVECAHTRDVSINAHVGSKKTRTCTATPRYQNESETSRWTTEIYKLIRRRVLSCAYEVNPLCFFTPVSASQRILQV